jgi:hypothetical protein
MGYRYQKIHLFILISKLYVHIALVKSAPKKSFAQETDYFRTWENFQLVKQFFG